MSSHFFDTFAPSLTSRAAPSPTNEPVAEEEEFYSSWSLFLVCVLLIISLWTSYYLQIKRIRAVHETLVSIFAGMAVGMVIRLVPGGGGMIREMLTFKHTIFFNLLLPPIILNSGYELKQENFFRNSGTILTFAFLGTFISAVGLGVLVYIYSFLGLESLELGLVECLIFGSTLSATDPVTILAIFNQYKVDPKLYSIIFGESLLNDAVSIVMYETLSHFHGSEFHLGSVFHSIGLFLVSFSVSLFIGVTFGLLTSLLLKHSHLRLYPHIETSLVALSAYTCYFFSNGLSMSNVSMSGIVALLFCGITLKHYAYHTMSRRTQRATKYIFRTLAGLSENFIFIYLGMALFTSAPQDAKVGTYIKPIFIVITTISVVFTRYAAVFPLAEAINFFHRHVRGQRSEELPHSYQMMLFWAGLRGAVGVALAAGFKGKNAGMLRTTVLVVVVLTVLMFGGTTAKMLEVLGIRTGVEDEAATSSDEEESGSGWLGGRRGRYGRYEDDEPSYLANGRGISSSRSYRGNRGRIGMHYPDQNGRHPYSNDYNYNYNHHPASQGQRGVPPSPLIPQGASPGIFSAASSDTDSEAGEVLPMAPTVGSGDASGSRAGADVKVGRVETDDRAEEGGGGMATHASAEWFHAIDERYLLPLFSNATASRTFHARRARRFSHQRTASGSADINAFGGGRDERSGDGGYASGPGTPIDSEDEGYEGARRGGAVDTRSPMLRSGGMGEVSGGRAS